MTDEMTVWSQINKRLGSKLSESLFRTWFSQVTLSKLDHNKAIIEVPNKFIANWLNDNYMDEIKKSFKAVIKKSLDIQIVHTSKSLKRIDKPLSKNRSILPNIRNIDRSKTFDQFITGECNSFAYSSALKVANNPSNNSYNPLYIYSQSSFGKTHLLNAIGNHIIEKDPNIKIDYISSKTFFSDYNNAIKTKKTHNFLEKYTNFSVLLFDDIQLLSNKKRIQEEFLSIFDHLYEEKKQIVISGDRLPNSLKHFNSHITSRLGSGLIAEIRPSDNDTKINIIKNNLKINNINIPNDIIIFLAKYSNNYKNLIRNTVRVGTYMSMNKGNINISMVKSLVKSNNKITVKDIQSITSGYFNISTSELLSFKKKRIYSYPRHMAMYLCKKNSDLSYKEIGARFGDRDHSTVIYAIKQIEKRSLENKDIRKDIININKLLV